MHARCVEAKDRRLATHEPEPLSPEVEREVERIVAAARRHLGGG